MTWVQWRIKLNGSHFATIMEHYTIDVSDVHWKGLHFATRKKGHVLRSSTCSTTF